MGGGRDLCNYQQNVSGRLTCPVDVGSAGGVTLGILGRIPGGGGGGGGVIADGGVDLKLKCAVAKSVSSGVESWGILETQTIAMLRPNRGSTCSYVIASL